MRGVSYNWDLEGVGLFSLRLHVTCRADSILTLFVIYNECKISGCKRKKIKFFHR